MSRRIDAHQHFWKVERGDYHWMPASGPLRHDYLPKNLAPLNRAAGFDGTILIQAAQTVAETDFLLDLADQTDTMVLGVTGWVPLDDKTAPAELQRLAQHPKLVAIRPMLHDLPTVDWISQPTVIENLRRLPGLNLRFEVLSFPMHLPAAFYALEQIPDLPVVIDHLSKPNYTAGIDADWRKWMHAFAQRPNAYCKLSGMVTEVGEGWSPDNFRAHADFVLDTFGPNRVMFGSDWPVCLQAATHTQIVELAKALTSRLTPTERDAVWGGTAALFYGV
jgi:L-fuconolactonase